MEKECKGESIKKLELQLSESNAKRLKEYFTSSDLYNITEGMLNQKKQILFYKALEQLKKEESDDEHVAGEPRDYMFYDYLEY